MLDFGNGFVAGGRFTDDIRIKDHEGIEAPTLETSILENAVTDGGSLGETRATTRRMRIVADFPNHTRKEILRAFRPNVVRMLTSEHGSIPYKVEVMPEFDSANLRQMPSAVIRLISDHAYPVGPAGYVDTGGTGGHEYPHEYPHEYDTAVSVGTLNVDCESDVETDPVIMLTLAAGGASLTITCNGETFTFTDTFTSGDVVVVDSAARTATLNGVNLLGSLDLDDASWPEFEPGTNTISTDISARIVVSWSPRLMGLL